MARLALEIHDGGLVALADGDEQLRLESPGVALWDGRRLMVGATAEGRARLRPKDVHRRFWQELSLAPLGPPFPDSWTVAELVHAHLEAVWQEVHEGVESVLLVASGGFSGKQLGLVLGIARSLKIPVRGLVDTALSAALPVAFDRPRGRLLHLDLHQHRAVLTEIERHRELARGRIEVEDRVGWVPLQDLWARHIADVFIHATRFDPLYDAELEQILYHQIPRWLGEVEHRDTIIPRLEGPGGEMSVELEREPLVQAASEEYDHLIRLVQRLATRDDPPTLLLSSHAARLPHLARQLQSITGGEVIELASDASVRGALLGRSAVETSVGELANDETLPYVVRLPTEAEKSGPIVRPVESTTGTVNTGAMLKNMTPTGAAVAADMAGLDPSSGAPAGSESGGSEPHPTHVLHRGQAYAIGSGPYWLGTQPAQDGRGLVLTGATAGISRRHLKLEVRQGELVLEDHSTYGTWLNGERVRGPAIVASGASIRLGSPGIEVQVIYVPGAST